MGNSLITCPCFENTKEGVLVMKADGDRIRFKKGVQAKEVVAANAGYRVVRCDSDRTVLRGSAELESNRLYFLVPEDKARCRVTFDKFWKIGESKGLVPPRSNKGSNEDSNGSLGSFVCSSEFRRLSWAPQLRTIPEILSPPAAAPQGFVAMKPSTAPQTPCSLGEQLGIVSAVSSGLMVR